MKISAEDKTILAEARMKYSLEVLKESRRVPAGEFRSCVRRAVLRANEAIEILEEILEETSS